MTDVERWVDLHSAELRALADRFGAHEDTVHFLASLVLAGAADGDIYEQLRELIPSADGQRSPLAGAPELVREVRHLVVTS